MGAPRFMPRGLSCVVLVTDEEATGGVMMDEFRSSSVPIWGSLTSLQSFKRRPDGLRACVPSLSSGGATRRPVGASRNDKRERRVSRLRNACIFRLTRPLLRERLFRYG